MKAIWKDRIIAESSDTVVVESNHYFPAESVHTEYLRESRRLTTCPWKGEARYFDLVADSDVSRNAAWTYPEPKDAARQIKDYIAFWKDVQVVE